MGQMDVPSDRKVPSPERLRQARILAEMTQVEVARQAGLSRKSISRYENGAQRPSMVALNMLAILYDRSVEWFLGEEGTEDNGQDSEPSIGADRELVMNEASLALRSASEDLSDEAIRSIANFIRFVHDEERR